MDDRHAQRDRYHAGARFPRARLRADLRIGARLLCVYGCAQGRGRVGHGRGAERRCDRAFKRHILPQMACGEKIHILQGDAFAFAGARTAEDGFTFAFADLWHDAGDGIPMYRRLKALEARNPGTEYAYWIEQSMQCYL